MTSLYCLGEPRVIAKEAKEKDAEEPTAPAALLAQRPLTRQHSTQRQGAGSRVSCVQLQSRLSLDYKPLQSHHNLHDNLILCSWHGSCLCREDGRRLAGRARCSLPQGVHLHIQQRGSNTSRPSNPRETHTAAPSGDGAEGQQQDTWEGKRPAG